MGVVVWLLRSTIDTWDLEMYPLPGAHVALTLNPNPDFNQLADKD